MGDRKTMPCGCVRFYNSDGSWHHLEFCDEHKEAIEGDLK